MFKYSTTESPGAENPSYTNGQYTVIHTIRVYGRVCPHCPWTRAVKIAGGHKQYALDRRPRIRAVNTDNRLANGRTDGHRIVT